MGAPLITPIGTDATPFRLPPPMPGTTAYANAVWTLAPPPAGTDDLLGAAPPLPLPLPLPIVRVGTPFVDAIGFRNPFLD